VKLKVKVSNGGKKSKNKIKYKLKESEKESYVLPATTTIGANVKNRSNNNFFKKITHAY